MARKPPASVKEQSHKREMDAAVRGDFARLRARAVSSTIRSSDERTPEQPDPESEHVAQSPRSEPVTEPSRPSAIRRLFRMR